MTRNQKLWKKPGKNFQETLWVTTRFFGNIFQDLAIWVNDMKSKFLREIPWNAPTSMRGTFHGTCIFSEMHRNLRVSFSVSKLTLNWENGEFQEFRAWTMLHSESEEFREKRATPRGARIIFSYDNLYFHQINNFLVNFIFIDKIEAFSVFIFLSLKSHMIWLISYESYHTIPVMWLIWSL